MRSWRNCRECGDLTQATEQLCMSCALLIRAEPRAPDGACSTGQFRVLALHWFLRRT